MVRPEGRAWPILAGATLIHVFYKIAWAMAYDRGAFTVVYPIVRGTGPPVTVADAGHRTVRRCAVGVYRC